MVEVELEAKRQNLFSLSQKLYYAMDGDLMPFGAVLGYCVLHGLVRSKPQKTAPDTARQEEMLSIYSCLDEVTTSLTSGNKISSAIEPMRRTVDDFIEEYKSRPGLRTGSQVFAEFAIHINVNKGNYPQKIGWKGVQLYQALQDRQTKSYRATDSMAMDYSTIIDVFKRGI